MAQAVRDPAVAVKVLELLIKSRRFTHCPAWLKKRRA